jgi:hypothetical protein
LWGVFEELFFVLDSCGTDVDHHRGVFQRERGGTEQGGI